jgi:hypothetical protein
MSNQLDRRQVLRASASAAVLAGLAAVGAAPARAADHGRHGEHEDPELPDVPGMLGDRRANEVWYQLDEAALYKVSPELLDAYKAIGRHVGGSIEREFRTTWLTMSKSPGYPGNYASFMAPIKGPLTVVSRMQLGVFDQLYRHHDPRLVAAFAFFGQGVLYDPRRESVRSPVHTMNSLPGMPPVGYHTWHAYMRAMMLLGIDRHRWEAFAPLNGFAWALASVAKPNSQTVSPPLPRKVVLELATSWLPRRARRLDADFQSVPYPDGIS